MPVVSVSHAENSVLYVSVCSCVCTIALFPFYTDDSESLSVCDLRLNRVRLRVQS